ncbi:MAG: DJ-1/PfpI family protein [Clostridia bacterium]|nr:DJ-1/PfpI family protein [Clostridia bacterium]
MACFYVFLAQGFEEVEALCTVDLLRRAGIKVVTAGVGSKTVTGSHSVTVTADREISELDDGFDGIVLPGGMPGTLNLERNALVQSFMKKAVETDRYLCAICAAPSIPGHAGYLKNKKAVCYPGFENTLEGAQVLFDGVCADGKIITSRGAGTAVDFALKIIELVSGKEESEKIRKGILYRE